MKYFAVPVKTIEDGLFVVRDDIEPIRVPTSAAWGVVDEIGNIRAVFADPQADNRALAKVDALKRRLKEAGIQPDEPLTHITWNDLLEATLRAPVLGESVLARNLFVCDALLDSRIGADFAAFVAKAQENAAKLSMARHDYCRMIMPNVQVGPTRPLPANPTHEVADRKFKALTRERRC